MDLLCFLLDKLTPNFTENLNSNLLPITLELYKSLRNCVTLNSEIQTYLGGHSAAILNTYTIVNMFNNELQPNVQHCMKMIIQFLNNLIVNNSPNSLKVYQQFHLNILNWIKDNVYCYHASGLLYNILHTNNFLIEENVDFFEAILYLNENHKSNEYSSFLMDLLLYNLSFCLHYPKFTVEQRITILEVLKCKCIVNQDNFKLFPELIILLTKEFQVKSDCILKTVTDYLKQIEPYEVSLLLEVLASISSEETHLGHLRKNKSFLINCTFLLKCIHTLGMQSQNNFTSIEKLSELTNVSLEMEEHPIFGFKANLIRIIGNLCWKHKDYQDEVCCICFLNYNIFDLSYF